MTNINGFSQVSMIIDYSSAYYHLCDILKLNEQEYSHELKTIINNSVVLCFCGDGNTTRIRTTTQLTAEYLSDLSEQNLNLLYHLVVNSSSEIIRAEEMIELEQAILDCINKKTRECLGNFNSDDLDPYSNIQDCSPFSDLSYVVTVGVNDLYGNI